MGAGPMMFKYFGHNVNILYIIIMFKLLLESYFEHAREKDVYSKYFS